MKMLFMIFFLFSNVYNSGHETAEIDVFFEQLFIAIGHVESDYQHVLDSGEIVMGAHGEIGLYQIKTNTFLWRINQSDHFKHLTIEDVYTRHWNIWAARDLFSYLYYNKFRGNTARAISAYNTGSKEPMINHEYVYKVLTEVLKNKGARK